MRIRCPGTILPTNKFFASKNFRKSLSAISSLFQRYIVSPYYLQFYINRTYHHMTLARDLGSNCHVAWSYQNLDGVVSADSLRPDARGGGAGKCDRIDRCGGGRRDSSVFAAAERA